MTRHSHSEARPSRESPDASARARELLRRIDELEREDDSAFGAFGAGDWLACLLAALLLPAALLLWFAP